MRYVYNYNCNNALTNFKGDKMANVMLPKLSRYKLVNKLLAANGVRERVGIYFVAPKRQNDCGYPKGLARISNDHHGAGVLPGTGTQKQMQHMIDTLCAFFATPNKKDLVPNENVYFDDNDINDKLCGFYKNPDGLEVIANPEYSGIPLANTLIADFGGRCEQRLGVYVVDNKPKGLVVTTISGLKQGLKRTSYLLPNTDTPKKCNAFVNDLLTFFEEEMDATSIYHLDILD